MTNVTQAEAIFGQWQPIDTAPKKGSIIVWSPLLGGRPVIASWDNDQYAKNPIPRFTTSDRIYGRRDLIGVTHWMPLPPPPQNNVEVSQ